MPWGIVIAYVLENPLSIDDDVDRPYLICFHFLISIYSLRSYKKLSGYCVHT